METDKLVWAAGSLGQVIRRARTNLGLTQEQLAILCDITSMYISQIERGVRIPKFKVCRALAKALHLNEKEFLLLAYRTSTPEEIRDLVEEAEIPLPDRCKKLLAALHSLPQETQEKILEFLEGAISIAKQ